MLPLSFDDDALFSIFVFLYFVYLFQTGCILRHSSQVIVATTAVAPEKTARFPSEAQTQFPLPNGPSVLGVASVPQETEGILCYDISKFAAKNWRWRAWAGEEIAHILNTTECVSTWDV